MEALRTALQQQRDVLATHEHVLQVTLSSYLSSLLCPHRALSLQDLQQARGDSAATLILMQRGLESARADVAALSRVQQELAGLRDIPTSPMPEGSIVAGVGRELDSLRQANGRLASTAAAHEQALADLRAALTDVASGLASIRTASQTHSAELGRLREATVSQTQSLAQVAESSHDTRDFINQEARTRIKDLPRPTVAAGDKMAVMGWIARNLKFLDGDTITEAVAEFRAYASANRDSFYRSQTRLPEVVAAIYALLEQTGGNVTMTAQLLDLLDCVLSAGNSSSCFSLLRGSVTRVGADVNLETALSTGLTPRMLRLVVHPTDALKARALQVLLGAARNGTALHLSPFSCFLSLVGLVRLADIA
jgi:hypothetical protein